MVQPRLLVGLKNRYRDVRNQDMSHSDFTETGFGPWGFFYLGFKITHEIAVAITETSLALRPGRLYCYQF